MSTDRLEVRIKSAGYGSHPVLRNVSVNLESGRVVTILGANGAGKSTLVRAVSGLIAYAGSVLHNGENLTGKRPERIARRGIIQVPEGRGTIAALSVRENLMIGAYRRRDRNGVRIDLDYVVTLFPRLAERHAQQAGLLSGGEQQMLAIGRALMGAPKLLLLDEPSLGLAPIVIHQIFEVVSLICRQRGVGILLVEQNAMQALSISSYGYVLEGGVVGAEGTAAELERSKKVVESYFGDS